MKISFAVACMVVAVAWGSPAQAQYYAPPPPPPGYYPPPPPPDYGYRRREIGERCEAFLPSPYGPRRLVCEIVEPKPVGRPCACPPPRGYPPEYVGGRTIR